MWAEGAWNKVSETLNNAFLKSHGKKNLRQLTKAQVRDLEQLKLDVFTNLDIDTKVDDSIVVSTLKSGKTTSQEFKDMLTKSDVNIDDMTIEDYRKNIIGLFVELNLG